MAKELYIDQDECTGCNLCVDTCPDVFKMNDDEIAEVVNAEGASEEDIQTCIDDCPVTCIYWKE